MIVIVAEPEWQDGSREWDVIYLLISLIDTVIITSSLMMLSLYVNSYIDHSPLSKILLGIINVYIIEILT
jgi:hypothetical protein